MNVSVDAKLLRLGMCGLYAGFGILVIFSPQSSFNCRLINELCFTLTTRDLKTQSSFELAIVPEYINKCGMKWKL